MPRCVKVKLLTVLLFFTLAIPLFAQEMLIISIFLNSEPKGETFGLITPDRDFLLSAGLLNELGISARGKEINIEGDTYISLRSLSPQVTFEFNEEDISLQLTATPELLGTASFDLGRKEPNNIYKPRENSAFLNYSFNYYADDGFEFREINVPLETGIRLNDYLLFSNFSYKYLDEDGDEFVRLLTNIVRDDRESMIRYKVGDFTASTGELGGGKVIGGFSISKNFSLNPYFLRYPGVNLEGLIYTPSDVELWKDGILLRSERLSPGKFDFQNVPVNTGSGLTEVVIRDAFGEEKRLLVPYHFTTRLLKKDTHEYSYNLGFIREEFGTKNFDYGKWAMLMNHRYGFNKRFTGGARAELSEDLASMGLSGSYSMGRIGVIDTAAAASFNSMNGHAYSLGYSNTLVKQAISWRVTLRGHSRHYSNLNLLPDRDRARNEIISSINYSNQRTGSFSLSYSSSDNYDSVNSERVTFRYSKSLTKKLNISLSASNTNNETTENEIFCTINYLFNPGTSGYASYRKTEDDESGSLSVQRTPVDRIGAGYRVVAEKTDNAGSDDTERYEAELNYRSKYGVYKARYNALDSSDSYLISASGSIGIVNGSIHPGQPVNDSFGIVKVGDFEDVEVYSSNALVGKTNSNGEIMVPFFSSYTDNSISVNDEDIPMNYTIMDIDKNVSPPYRSGSYLKFDVEKIQSIIGIMLIKDKTGTVPAEFWNFIFEYKGKTINVSTVREGEFYLENIEDGIYKAIINKDEKECRFDLIIPESSEAFIDLGNITCDMD